MPGQIEVNMLCKFCPSGQAPNEDNTACEEKTCPGDCTNSTQGICNIVFGTCTCMSGFIGSDCSSKHSNILALLRQSSMSKEVKFIKKIKFLLWFANKTGGLVNLPYKMGIFS